jgi:hypothetical protein
MLEPWIIEQIRRREEEERRRNERPRLEIPAHDRRRDPDDKDDRGKGQGDDKKDDEDTPERGVMIIDFG